MSIDITLEDLVQELGEYKKRGQHYYFQCKYCLDEHRDNMIYTPSKNLLKCFADESHSRMLLSEIMKKKYADNQGKEYKPMTTSYEPKPTVNIVHQWELNRDEYLEYMCLTQQELFKRQDLLDYIYEKRGLRKETLELCGVGFDPSEGANGSWVLPIFSLKYGCIVDFELREHGEKKLIKRVGGGCATIAEIYGKKQAKTLYLLEGQWKSYALVQYLLDKGVENFSVYSCSNGVGSLFGCMNEINFSNFEEVKLMLDADDEGSKVTEKIIAQMPFVKDVRGFLFKSGHKDFDSWYVAKVLKREV